MTQSVMQGVHSAYRQSIMPATRSICGAGDPGRSSPQHTCLNTLAGLPLYPIVSTQHQALTRGSVRCGPVSTREVE
jgi:hypothetical protein